MLRTVIGLPDIGILDKGKEGIKEDGIEEVGWVVGILVGA